MTNRKIESEYSEAIFFAKNHYENFPVISFLIPKRLQKHIAVVYKFARLADDIADETKLPSDERLKLLDNFSKEFNRALKNNFASGFWNALKNTIDLFNLTPENFSRLLTAFKSDILFTEFQTFPDVLNYCSNSANPVGRIILEIFDIRDEQAVHYSDNVCTALQLINFYQDVSIDIKQNRIYIPQDEMKQFSVTADDIKKMKISGSFRELMKLQINRVDSMFAEGRNILPYLPYRLKKEISWTILGGEKISEKIKKNDYNVLNYRPEINTFEVVMILLKSFFI